MNETEQLKQQNNFLHDFIKDEMYLQEPPIEMANFIEFCKKIGIQTSEKELEYFEKEKLLFPIIRIERPIIKQEIIKFKKADGKEYSRPAQNGLQIGDTEIERYKNEVYSSYGFSENESKLLLNWFDEGVLFDPAQKEFKSLDDLLSKEVEYDKKRIISFYSRFQIYYLEILNKAFSITLNLAGDEIMVSSPGVSFNNQQGQASFSLSKFDDFAIKLRDILNIECFKEYFDFEKKKEKLKEEYKEFDKILKLLLSVQSAYFPYVRSGGGTIQVVTLYNRSWHEIKHNFNLELILNKNNINIKDVVKWYRLFSDKARNLLGIKKDDWMQLWKNIGWSKKDKLEGNVRLGVEYLQWAVMLKKVIEEHLQKQILDIDEISNNSDDDILEFEPNQMEPKRTLRDIRNEKYSDNEKNYYYDRYKRLLYFANDFELDYQPRVIVFVEGKIEETIFPEIFELYNGQKPDNMGIEFISIEGISQFFGQKIAEKDLNNKYKKIFISNFNHLVSYNLIKWQIIPFFIGDDENNITSLLNKENVISFNQNQYPFPKEWQYIWGIANENKPLQGKDLEMSNFTDDEIAMVLKLYIPITSQEIEDNRKAGKGIKQISSNVEMFKIKIVKTLFQNLFDNAEKEKKESIYERPIFKAIDKITNLAVFNHPPSNRNCELKNKEYIEEVLRNNGNII